MLWVLALLMGGLGFGYVTVRRKRKAADQARVSAHRFSSKRVRNHLPGAGIRLRTVPDDDHAVDEDVGDAGRVGVRRVEGRGLGHGRRVEDHQVRRVAGP